MSKELFCTIWNNGFDGWGIRVRSKNRRYFDRSRPTVTVELDGKDHEFNLSDTFWTTCPEFRGKAIREWLQHHKINRENKTNYAVILSLTNEKFKARLMKK